ncbi:hypothetical protein AU468_12450 [Alkalispirochaeta sphaeroplastigenens]|uniref:Uncharacterized protein n=1 Tax=Alkalispirochaeta sphaeroplastigenens TaxID=1187066 RepID=A0A2S4JGI3_9SPIO|nr:hypothetical protein [Alkalispirochaeta sphaeroplastigenens]POQ98667.1 hypothetical protein AU468_12450 [Alkalispirochaeta sphaeroplastigenens]
MVGNYDLLSRRAGFNTALRHFRTATSLLEPVSGGANFADLIALKLDEEVISRDQVRPLTSALLVDKFSYQVRSRNAPRTIESAGEIQQILSEWTALQIVIAYEHPQAGLLLINPRNLQSWEPALPIICDELLVVYLENAPGASLPAETLERALGDVHSVLAGLPVDHSDQRYRLPEGAHRPAPVPAARAAAPTPAPPKAGGGKKRITPRYSVVVTNELFHNGNVEAWKRIIASYRTTYPDLNVLIWYENERINDINALFKWGKVKHGTPIMVSVTGEEIRDVSKLQRYLFEGASHRFEMFLKGGIDQPLELF